MNSLISLFQDSVSGKHVRFLHIGQLKEGVEAWPPLAGTR